jgi:hypothetical protein
MGLFLARNGKLGLCSTLDKVGCSLMCIGLGRYYKGITYLKIFLVV